VAAAAGYAPTPFASKASMLLLHHAAIKWSARMDLHHRSPKATGLQPVSIAALTLAD